MGKYQWKEGAKGKIKICAFVEFNSTFNLQDEATLPKMNMKATNIYFKDKARYALLELKKDWKQSIWQVQISIMFEFQDLFYRTKLLPDHFH